MFHVKRNRQLLVPNTYAAKKAWAARWLRKYATGDLSWSGIMGVLWVLENDGRDDVAKELVEAILDHERTPEEGVGENARLHYVNGWLRRNGPPRDLA